MIMIMQPESFIRKVCFNFCIRFGVIRLVVRAQERYTLGGPGGMLSQEKF